MSVELDPPELGFRRPFTHEVSQVLRLRNPTGDPIAFKVKTTAPKQYCVRPNSGRIEPGKEVEIQVLLQAMKEDPPLDARCRDKFLVQSVAIAPHQDTGNVAAIWSGIEKESRDAIKERKIRVTFLPARDSTPSHIKVNGVQTSEEVPAHGSPSQSFASPAYDTSPRDRVGDTSAKDSVASNLSSPSTFVSAAAPSISNTAASTGQAIQQHSSDAKDSIKQIGSPATDQGLRQRKSDAVVQDEEKSTTTVRDVQTQHVDGVPVQIVAFLCLLSFLLAYFFF